MFAANPDAFVNHDINQLKVAQILHIPTPESIKGEPPQNAKEPAQPTSLALRDQTAGAKPSTSPKFVLQISPGDTESDTGDSKNLPEAEHLNNTASHNPPAIDNRNASINPEKTPLAEVTEFLPPDTLQSAPVITLAKTSAAPLQTVPEPALGQSIGNNNTSFSDGLITNLPWIAFGMAISLVLIMLGLFFNKRRFAALQNWQQRAFGEEVLPFSNFQSKSESPFAIAPTAEPLPLSESMGLYNDKHTSLGTGMDVNEIDPMVEAEIYISYGRDKQAENILINALAKAPHKHELSLSLLKIYADRKDTVSFERIARKVYESAESGGIENAVLWGRAAIKGHKLDPENPLYQIESVTPDQHDDAELRFESLEVPAEPVQALSGSIEEPSVDFVELPSIQGFAPEASPQLGDASASSINLPQEQESALLEVVFDHVKLSDKSNVLTKS